MFRIILIYTMFHYMLTICYVIIYSNYILCYNPL